MDAGGASRFFFNVSQQIDEADPVYYCAKASRRERDAGLEGMPLKLGREMMSSMGQGNTPQQTPHRNEPQHNPHPTVKPLSLTKYLATLLLPPAEYATRRILIPFAGVASEMVGAHQAGWEIVTGIEREAEYVEIGRARLAYWCAKTDAQMPLPVEAAR
jgi:site-specific DNA-methyltransferase (adenine-specific)